MNMKKKIFVSSTVYHFEELLELIYSKLVSLGFEVWMSYKGTIPVSSEKTAFQNCVEAVSACDYFLGIITPTYGSGIDPSEPTGISITHQEFKEAIRLKKPRWVLVHDHVVFMRNWLNKMGYKHREGREQFPVPRDYLDNGNKVFDLRTIDIYDEVIQDFEISRKVSLKDRVGNWAQPFVIPKDAEIFTMAQFSRYQEVAAFVGKNFARQGGRV